MKVSSVIPAVGQLFPQGTLVFPTSESNISSSFSPPQYDPGCMLLRLLYPTILQFPCNWNIYYMTIYTIYFYDQVRLSFGFEWIGLYKSRDVRLYVRKPVS